MKMLLEEEYQVLKESLSERIHMLERKVLEWEGLVDGSKIKVYKQQLYDLGNRLREWAQSWKRLKHSKPEGPTGAGIKPPVPNTPYAPPPSGMYPGFKPQISLERTRLPVFSGDMTDYYRWKTEWEELEQLGNPQRTAGVTRFHLLASLSDRVKKDLVLSSCATADEMFRRLDNRFGNNAKIVLKISEEVEGLPSVKGNNPRKAIELIQAVERAISNLVILGEEDVIRNHLVAQSLERKLPSSLKEKWIAHKTEPVNGFASHNHFDCLLHFLKKQETILEELDQLEVSPGEGNSSVRGPADKPDKAVKKAFSKATSGQRGSQSKPRLGSCTACADETHPGRLFACRVFREMDIQRRKTHLKTHGMCNRCLCFHLKDGRCNQKFLCTKTDCRKEEPHHYLLCSKSIAQEKYASCPTIIALVRLVDPLSFSSLARLCGTIAWMRRAVETWLGGNSQAPVCSKWEARPYLSAEERAEAFKSLALAVQDGVEFRDTTMDRLVVQKEEKTGLLLCGGRIQRWEEDRVAVPLIPCQSWLATLLAREAHEENHEGVASTLLRTSRKAWIMQGRRTVKKVLNSCVTCRKRRAEMCRQVMSDLPPERTQRASPFEFTTLDLFGPFEVKDAVKRRTNKKVWGIVYCCIASRAVHADLTDDQSAESFLQAYSRFVALGGHPRKLWSDRAGSVSAV
ncbi:hypothetical protein ACEWY4_028093 [Coilia grayii]|uniref:Integrase zinc-binding domain-containing protein n=1 Tax=Coilia grayii TaxID=363190 RepID=A0ABD1INB1_9TELE